MSFESSLCGDAYLTFLNSTWRDALTVDIYMKARESNGRLGEEAVLHSVCMGIAMKMSQKVYSEKRRLMSTISEEVEAGEKQVRLREVAEHEMKLLQEDKLNLAVNLEAMEHDLKEELQARKRLEEKVKKLKEEIERLTVNLDVATNDARKYKQHLDFWVANSGLEDQKPEVEVPSTKTKEEHSGSVEEQPETDFTPLEDSSSLEGPPKMESESADVVLGTEVEQVGDFLKKRRRLFPKFGSVCFDSQEMN